MFSGIVSAIRIMCIRERNYFRGHSIAKQITMFRNCIDKLCSPVFYSSLFVTYLFHED